MYRLAIQVDPNFADAESNLGNALKDIVCRGGRGGGTHSYTPPCSPLFSDLPRVIRRRQSNIISGPSHCARPSQTPTPTSLLSSRSALLRSLTTCSVVGVLPGYSLSMFRFPWLVCRTDRLPRGVFPVHLSPPCPEHFPCVPVRARVAYAFPLVSPTVSAHRTPTTSRKRLKGVPL